MKKPPPPERRGADRKPVRLKVVFRTAHSLLTEYTTSVSKGGCRIEAHQPIEIGTRFIFEMFAGKSRSPVEIEGVVKRCEKASTAGRYEIGIQYTPAEGKRAALEGVIDEIFSEHEYEKARRHARVPVNLIATDAGTPQLKYLIRDLSLGGLGLRLPAGAPVPAHVQVGSGVRLTVRSQVPIEIAGEVVWTVAGIGALTHPGIGISFVGMGPEQEQAIDALSRLQRTVALTLSFTPKP